VGRRGGSTARGVVLSNPAILLVIILCVTDSAERSIQACFQPPSRLPESSRSSRNPPFIPLTSGTTNPYPAFHSSPKPWNLLCPSTEMTLLAVTESLREARVPSFSAVLILLDLYATIDTVNHQILLSTLESPLRALHCWIHSIVVHFLPDRSHLSDHME